MWLQRDRPLILLCVLAGSAAAERRRCREQRCYPSHYTRPAPFVKSAFQRTRVAAGQAGRLHGRGVEVLCSLGVSAMTTSRQVHGDVASLQETELCDNCEGKGATTMPFAPTYSHAGFVAEELEHGHDC